MSVKLIFQKDGNNTLSENITIAFERKPKKAYFFCSSLKETGFRIIEEDFIDSKTKIYFAIGIDKKNTTRNMLENLLLYTKDVYFYSNNQLVEFDGNICIFEYEKEAVMYTTNSSMSESGLKDNLSIYTEYTYNLEDKDSKQEYKNIIKELTSKIEDEGFIKLDKNAIERLVEEKEIFTTRQYNHNVKSIAELLGKSNERLEDKVQVKEEADDVYLGEASIPKFDLSDSDIDIEIDDFVLPEEDNEKIENKEKVKEDIEVEENKEDSRIFEQNSNEYDDNISYNNELYDEDLEDFDFDENETLDIDKMLFSKADIKLNVGDKKAKKVIEEKENDGPEKEDESFDDSDEVVQVKKVNLNNVSNLIFELPSKPSKGQDVNSIKIPNYIKSMIPEFFEINENGKNVDISGASYRKRDIKIEIVDVKSGTKYTDREAKILSKNGQTYITITSDSIKNIEYSENDIIRIIKLASDIYHIEFVSKDLQEYKLWNKLCTQKFKASTRKYGMM